MLSFNIPPDHENPDDAATADNTYKIVVVASDDALGAETAKMGYKKMTVTVTEVDEPGVVTLPSLQPQVGVELTATLADPEVPSPTTVTWEWEKSRNGSSGLVGYRRRRCNRVHTGRYSRGLLSAGDGDL